MYRLTCKHRLPCSLAHYKADCATYTYVPNDCAPILQRVVCGQASCAAQASYRSQQMVTEGPWPSACCPKGDAVCRVENCTSWAEHVLHQGIIQHQRQQ